MSIMARIKADTRRSQDQPEDMIAEIAESTAETTESTVDTVEMIIGTLERITGATIRMSAMSPKEILKFIRKVVNNHQAICERILTVRMRAILSQRGAR